MHRTTLASLLCFLIIPLGLLLTGSPLDGRFLLQADRCQPAGSAGADRGLLLSDHDRPHNQAVAVHVPHSRLQACHTPIRSVTLDRAFQTGRSGTVPGYALTSLPLPLSGTEPASLTLTAQVRGAISYFAGQTTLLGQVMPVQPMRFLAGERLDIELVLNQAPDSIEIRLNGQVWQFTGITGQTAYLTSIFLPDWPETITWQHVRTARPMSMEIRAVAGSSGPAPVSASVTIPRLDLTGHIRDILHAQPTRP